MNKLLERMIFWKRKMKLMDQQEKPKEAVWPQEGDLRVWWKPQIPCRSFYVPVASLREAMLVCDALARYDWFQYENHVKGEFANGGGLQEFIPELAAEDPTSDGWVDWCDPEEGKGWVDYMNAHPELLDPHGRGCPKTE
jgi:hypothetical protein